ncbi:hypothetical protein Ava_3379 [Trichormus variabilis ATCC 29413]|uniref:Uncharacterized protein n=1 Tax=Trichormus variabilis (strain ATCC 29413 / PCC 7937) TaxID=240292 RepID=Q3M7Q0_TRIV2|nr:MULTISPECIES: hypothetical protein [Nostocaceae]ABA22986.1 hypothetical protein Ava_3379 [Trichormus variabilis ATCC 29413]
MNCQGNRRRHHQISRLNHRGKSGMCGVAIANTTTSPTSASNPHLPAFQRCVGRY